jgi:hypothetical protein
MDRPTDLTTHPLGVDAPTFIVREVVQSSPYTDAVNTITVTLRSNTAATRPTKVTVSGLMGSVTLDNKAMQITAIGAAIFEDTAVWSASSGSVVLTFVENADSVAGTDYAFSFTLANPSTAQSAPVVSVSSNEIAPRPATSPLHSGLTNGTQVPLLIISPRLETIKIGQSSALPGARNTITITLEANAPLRPNPRGAITISGFQGANMPPGSIPLRSATTKHVNFKDGPEGTPGTAMWRDGELTLFVADTLDAADENVISFDVINPTCSHLCSHLEAQATGLIFQPVGCGIDVSYAPSNVPIELEVLTPPMESDACPMKVYTPSFEVKRISECSPVREDPNTLTISLVPNVGLPAGTVIELAGLCPCAGGCPCETPFFDTPNPEIFGADAPMFNGLAWEPVRGSLKLTLQDEAGILSGQPVVFSFSVKNPAVANVGVTPSVWALHPTPSTLNPQPSTPNPQPSTLNPQPSTLNPQPSTPHPSPGGRGVLDGDHRRNDHVGAGAKP